MKTEIVKKEGTDYSKEEWDKYISFINQVKALYEQANKDGKTDSLKKMELLFIKPKN